MSIPPLTFEDTHVQNWFPTRTGGPTEVGLINNGSWNGASMNWGYANQAPLRTVRPYGQQVDPVNGRGAACSDYPHPKDRDPFVIDMRIP